MGNGHSYIGNDQCGALGNRFYVFDVLFELGYMCRVYRGWLNEMVRSYV